MEQGRRIRRALIAGTISCVIGSPALAQEAQPPAAILLEPAAAEKDDLSTTALSAQAR